MPFKDKLIKEMQKCISQFSQAYTTQNSIPAEEERQLEKNHKNKHSKVVLAKSKNIYQLFLKRTPQVYVHVANFFNMVGINEQAIRSEDFEQSYCRTVFYMKSIKKAEVRSNCVVFHLQLSNYSFSPIQYSIERFKSFGDSKFFNIACMMQAAISRLNELKSHVGKQMKDENNDAFDKYVESLRNRMFVIKTSSKMVLSKAFIELLQYNPEDYTIESVKFKSSLYQGCSTKNYYDVMMKALENIKSLIDLLFDRISLETFLDNSIIRFKDYLYTKNHKKVLAKVKAGMPNPFLTIYQVEEVISVSDEFSATPYFKGERKEQLNEIKQELINSEVKTMRNLMKLPPSYLPQNKHKVSEYTQNTSLKQENLS